MPPFQQYQALQRQYTVLPAIEQTKLMVLEKLRVLYDGVALLFYSKMREKRDDDVTALLKSNLIAVYLFLKPKIREYVNKTKPIPEEFTRLLKLEDYILNPSDLTVEKTLEYIDLINIFCHEYGVTRITYFTGTTGGGGVDTYSISR
jgi:hypothetical protein